MVAAQENPFSVRKLLGSPDSHMASVLAKPVDRLVGLDALRDVYDNVNASHDGAFSERALRTLGISAVVDDTDLQRIPTTGPSIVVANHPLGGADGLLLLDLVRRVRPDVKLLANSWLTAMPELGQDLIPVDVMNPGNPINSAALRQALRWLREGKCLATFPAGEVSRLRFRDGEVSDGPWAGSISLLARCTEASVTPLYFDAANSWLFQAVGRLHPMIRTALLPRELLRQRGAKIRVRLGGKITAERIKRFNDDHQASAYLRARTYLLSDRAKHAREVAPGLPIAPAVDPVLLQRDVDALAPDRTLARVGVLRVLTASAPEIPAVLQEIGRLREATFREVGEGTGQPTDLDEFDKTYRHLFVWSDAEHAVVGAYRLGLTDELLDASGLPRLYTAALFRYEPAQLRRLVPGIELGRSFVRVEHQCHFAPLLLLWQGIGQIVVANPKYKLLFGTASISDTYPSLSRKLLVRFVTEAFGPGEYASIAQPTTPPSFDRARQRETDLACSCINDISDADEIVSAIDPHGRGIPILLRQYLRLGARLIGFNVDAAFGDALDGLIVVDLTRAPARQVTRYLGKEGYASFMQYHAARG